MNRPATWASRTCFGLAGLLTIIVGIVALRLDFAFERELWLLRASGYAAMGSLFLSLSMSPLRRLRQWTAERPIAAAPWVAMRRSAGIMSACFALVHASLALTTYLEDSWAAVVTWPYLRAGLAALAILTALLLTSFPRLVRAFRVRLWKPLHRLAYVAALLVFQHMMLAPFAPKRWTLALFALLLAVSCLRWLPKRERKPLQRKKSST